MIYTDFLAPCALVFHVKNLVIHFLKTHAIPYKEKHLILGPSLGGRMATLVYFRALHNTYRRNLKSPIKWTIFVEILQYFLANKILHCQDLLNFDALLYKIHFWQLLGFFHSATVSQQLL